MDSFPISDAERESRMIFVDQLHSRIKENEEKNTLEIHTEMRYASIRKFWNNIPFIQKVIKQAVKICLDDQSLGYISDEQVERAFWLAYEDIHARRLRDHLHRVFKNNPTPNFIKDICFKFIAANNETHHVHHFLVNEHYNKLNEAFNEVIRPIVDVKMTDETYHSKLTGYQKELIHSLFGEIIYRGYYRDEKFDYVKFIHENTFG